jgi:hypothetical protein
MIDPTERKIGGESVHVGDCYIWAAISYLDSPTDYRKYLPCNRVRINVRAPDDLIMLDSARSSSGSDTKITSGWGTLLFVLITAGIFLYLIREGL